MPKPKATLIIQNAAELLTMASNGKPLAGKAAGNVGTIPNGAMAIAGERIIAVGTTSAVLKAVDATDARIIDATGKTVLPGFVDCHTHLVFAGSREEEVELKAQGVPYLEILKRGGGIHKTVRKTRAATEAQLVQNATRTLQTMLQLGTTTVEAKSGYGLEMKTEMKLLDAATKAAKQSPVDVINTFLGAHAVPQDLTADQYTKAVIDNMIPEAQRRAEYCDVFCEKDVFTVDQSRRILEAGKKAGLKTRIHADQLHQTGGAELAADLKATSADHLIHASSSGIAAMAKNGTVAVLLPATGLSSLLPYANARAFIDAGVPVALGTDFNPNCWCESMPFSIALACRYLKMTPSEAIAAATINSAASLDRADSIGSLELGKQADILVLDAPNHTFLAYQFGVNRIETVVKKGKVVVENETSKMPT
ncbi:imidazolonepropionase [Candidatus Micrarchaeota archaeon]|nr:imidazolonepropionase [Candidatus Micrarchaeota archaeon]